MTAEQWLSLALGAFLIVAGVTFILVRQRAAAARREFYDHAPHWYGWGNRTIQSSPQFFVLMGLLLVAFGFYVVYRTLTGGHAGFLFAI